MSHHFQDQIQSTLFTSIYPGASEKENMQAFILTLALLVTWALDP